MQESEYFAGYADGLEAQLNQQRGVKPEVDRAEVLQTAQNEQAAAGDDLPPEALADYWLGYYHGRYHARTGKPPFGAIGRHPAALATLAAPVAPRRPRLPYREELDR